MGRIPDERGQGSGWEPTEGDIAWTKGVLDNLEEGQDWMEGEMAFRKVGDKQLLLLTRTERAGIAAERVKFVLEELGWSLDESLTKIIPDDPMLAATMMQEEANSWCCPKCEEHKVVNMDLETATWQLMGNSVYVDEDGDSIQTPRWVVETVCPCEEKIYLSPDDYLLVAGEMNFYTWNVDEQTLRVMFPEQITECVDNETLDVVNAIHLGTTYQGNTVPPHLRGSFCMVVDGPSSGEEE